MHGGISPELNIRKINDIPKPYSGFSREAIPLVNDLLWSDPDFLIEGFQPSERGIGKKYGADVTEAFLENNGLNRIVRAHQVAEEGYEDVFRNGRVITVFSSPGYNVTFEKYNYPIKSGYEEGINSGALVMINEDAIGFLNFTRVFNRINYVRIFNQINNPPQIENTD